MYFTRSRIIFDAPINSMPSAVAINNSDVHATDSIPNTGAKSVENATPTGAADMVTSRVIRDVWVGSRRSSCFNSVIFFMCDFLCGVTVEFYHRAQRFCR